jgi:hypothetical protein
MGRSWNSKAKPPLKSPLVQGGTSERCGTKNSSYNESCSAVLPHFSGRSAALVNSETKRLQKSGSALYDCSRFLQRRVGVWLVGDNWRWTSGVQTSLEISLQEQEITQQQQNARNQYDAGCSGKNSA